MTWHVDPELIAGYTKGGLTPAHAASVETHVMTCAECRRMLAETADPGRIDRIWSAIEDRVDEPRRGPVERLLVRAGLRDHTARLVVVTPSLRLSWLTAVAALLFLSAVWTRDSFTGDRSFFLFLVLAPLLPLAGVGVAFGLRTDPAHELTVASPVSAIEILLVRALAVLATTTVLTSVAAIAIPENDWSAAAWLLPALGLTTAALALSRWVPAVWAAVGFGVAWLAAASSTLVGGAARAHLVEHFVAFRPAGQGAFLAITIIAAAVLVQQRDAFDFGRTT